jgi:hypothetical protein
LFLLSLIAKIAELIDELGVAIGAGTLRAFFGDWGLLGEKVVGERVRDCAVFESSSASLAD